MSSPSQNPLPLEHNMNRSLFGNRWLRAFFFLVTVPLSGSGCASCESNAQKGISLMSGTINDPRNKTLRRGMLQFGINKACEEMSKRPSALREGGESGGSVTNPSNGRVFIRTCQTQQTSQGDLVISFSASGYAWIHGMRKISFDASATLHIDPDFFLSGDVLYGYFRTKDVVNPQVQVKVIENSIPSLINSFTNLGEKYGKQLLSDKLRDGFTVRRHPNSETDFRPGIIELGTWPTLGYRVQGGVIQANDRAEVHENQRDFIGPFEIDDNDKKLYMTVKMDGTHAINVLVIPDAMQKPMLETYLGTAAISPFPSAPLQQHVATQGNELRVTVGGKGTYWLVLDNSATVPGGASPPGQTLDDRAAVVNYAVVLGDR